FLEIESDADMISLVIFIQRILFHEKSVSIITLVAQEKKLAVSFASLLFEDFDPPFYEPIVFKEVPNSMRLLPFSSENEEKVFKPGIYTSEKYSRKLEDSCQRILSSKPSFPQLQLGIMYTNLID
nr:hypothetical protein [Tanacetum cinerariifolium]